MTALSPLLIENWLPIEEIGAEGKRERGASSALPPLYFLHVWWARRPLIASRAAVLASVLPAWSDEWPSDLLRRFPNEETYRQWFIHLIGIRGDPVQGRKLIDWAKAKDIRLSFHPYGGAPRAFTVNPAEDDLETMYELLRYTWGEQELTVLDPFAGGGSIPFEALRYGFTTIANDLNPVAAVILKATLDYPARFGPSLADDIRKWGTIWAERVEEKLAPYFPKQPGENIFAYLWARTVACPTTGKPVPLSPNWWLRKGSDPVAVKLIAEPGMDEPRFEIVTGARARAAKPSEGTVSRGIGRSPWTGETIEADYIKTEARAGRLGDVLYAVATKNADGLGFRIRTAQDQVAVQGAVSALEENKREFVLKNLMPTEPIPEGNDKRPLFYGMDTWSDMFSPRQLLATATFVAELLGVQEELSHSSRNESRAVATATYLGLAVSKCVDYNSRQTFWDPNRGIRHAFSRHDFAFRWNPTEFDAATNLLPWAVSQVESAFADLAGLVAPSQRSLTERASTPAVQRLLVKRRSATDLGSLPDGALNNVTVDPPYYDNVQYAELSDYFYVWLKRSVGHLFPEFFTDELTNKDDEAVANPARFDDFGRKKKALAEQDYELKMAAAFREMHRVLRPDGSLTVMFTHKKVEAWDALASALIGAGFTIKASWPVHTESEHSLHQAKKNAASSTILLACRKRQPPGDGADGPVWWDDLQGRVRETAREKAAEFSEAGIRGVDLYISTFGPTLGIISERWPVLTSEVDPKTGQPRPLRPETALDLAREEVVRLRRQGLLLGQDIQFDPVTDWYLMAWDAFGAEQFPYDEARKLAIALGVDLDRTIMGTKRIATKKGQYIVVQQPAKRRKRGMVDDEVATFEHWIDAAHTVMMIYQEDGAGACDVFLRRAGLKNDGTFKALLQALINAIPRTRIKGKFARPEAEALENLRLAFFDELEAPAEEEPELPQATQLGLGGDFEEESEDFEDEDEEDEDGE
jgi:putative DNA methylase